MTLWQWTITEHTFFSINYKRNFTFSLYWFIWKCDFWLSKKLKTLLQKTYPSTQRGIQLQKFLDGSVWLTPECQKKNFVSVNSHVTTNGRVPVELYHISIKDLIDIFMLSSPISFSVQLIFLDMNLQKYHFRKKKTALLKEKWFIYPICFPCTWNRENRTFYQYNLIPKTIIT